MDIFVIRTQNDLLSDGVLILFEGDLLRTGRVRKQFMIAQTVKIVGRDDDIVRTKGRQIGVGQQTLLPERGRGVGFGKARDVDVIIFARAVGAARVARLGENAHVG